MNQTINRLLRYILSQRTFVNYWAILLLDALLSTAATLFTLLFIDNFIEALPNVDYLILIPFSFVISFFTFWLLKINRNIIRHSTLKSVWRIMQAIVLKELVLFMAVVSLPDLFQISFPFICVFVDISSTIISILGVRILMLVVYDIAVVKFTSHKMRVLIYDTTDKSVSLYKRLYTSRRYSVIGFINLDSNFKSCAISELPVHCFSSEESFLHFVDKNNIKSIIFPGYSEAKRESDRLLRYCQDSGVRTLVSPPIDDLSTTAAKPAIREIKIEDLLGRDEININMQQVHDHFADKVVMVTGAAGSIGSELCRQLVTFGIKQLILFDNAETPMHEFRLELERTHPGLSFVPFIGDVRQKERLQMVFEKYRPQVVFHAAAYKHVPLMEENPCEAVRVNVVGSRMLADFCVEYGVEEMVMVSTDKAVNPTNVMGCSKRLAEIYVQSLGLAMERGEVKGKTKFITTRFGNVLGSNGSVIPYFRKQIEQGGPVTVTHPEINRYFMTIPEACRLVLEAATMSTGNQIFVFDMGEPVKIVDLAERMIRLAGFTPYEEIPITFSGLRPGEKLYEELLSNEENTIPTGHKKIRIAKVREYKRDEILPSYEKLSQMALSVRVEDAVKMMKVLVPEFKSKNSVYERFDR